MGGSEGPLRPDEIPDWRLHFAARVADVKPRGPVGRALIGDIITLMGETKTGRDGRILIPIPGPYRLALNAAIKAAREAVDSRQRVTFNRKPDPSAVRTLDFRTIGALFDYLEQAMTCATLSYQAIEAYANVSISEQLGDDRLEVQYRGRVQECTAAEIERRLSTEEKIGEVLPRLRELTSPKGTKVWERFKRLKGVRDSGVHLKLKEFRAVSHLGKDSVVTRLLDTDPRSLVRVPVDVMRYFAGEVDVTWLDHAEKMLLQDGQG